MEISVKIVTSKPAYVAGDTVEGSLTVVVVS